MPVKTTGSKYGFETTTGLTTQHGLFEALADPKHSIGTRMQLADGRVFYYTKAGAVALSKGYLNMMALAIGGHELCDVAVAVDAFDAQITLTPATAPVTVNQYAEGYVSTRSVSAMGQMRKIRSHPAAAIAANVVVTTYDPFTEAITTSGFADLIKNPYDEVIESAVEENVAVGVPLVDVAADYYFWNQTYGPANVLSDDVINPGATVIPGTVAGSVAENAAIPITVSIVGIGMLLSVDATHAPVFLKLAP